MQHEEELTLESDHDALAHSPDADDFLSFGGGYRRRHAAQHEGIHEAHALERAPREAAFQMLDIDDDVGQLRHRGSFTQLYAADQPRLRAAARLPSTGTRSP